MATFTEVRKKIISLPEKLNKYAPDIIAETATEYYRDSFRQKGWDGEPWPAAKNPPSRGSLMVRSGELQASIRPSLVTPRELRISGGSPSVPYAKTHNQGAIITQTPTDKQRRFFWAMEYAAGGGQGGELGRWGRMAVAKQIKIDIPRRKFMGASPRLNKVIIDRLKLLLKSI